MSNNLQIIRGDDAAITFKFTDVDGLAIDLTDCTVYLTAKKKLTDGDDDAVISESVSSIANPTDGEARITIPRAVTGLLKGNYYWDCQIRYNDGTIQSTKYGVLEVVPDVTRREEVS